MSFRLTDSDSLFFSFFLSFAKLIKTKLETIEKGRYRLGIRVRANPKNDYILQNLVVLVVVPPDVNVDDPPEGGIWDELKRTLSWTCGSLQSGHGVYIQPTFTTNTINDSRRFPILLHSQGDHLFSRLDIRGNTIDERPLDLEVQHETTILYRKI